MCVVSDSMWLNVASIKSSILTVSDSPLPKTKQSRKYLWQFNQETICSILIEPNVVFIIQCTFFLLLCNNYCHSILCLIEKKMGNCEFYHLICSQNNDKCHINLILELSFKWFKLFILFTWNLGFPQVKMLKSFYSLVLKLFSISVLYIPIAYYTLALWKI